MRCIPISSPLKQLKRWEYLEKPRTETADTLYKNWVLVHCDYCDMIYECTSKQNLKRLHKSQNSTCRTLLLTNKWTSVGYMHNKLKLLTREQWRYLHGALGCFKNVNEDSSLNGLLIECAGRQARDNVNFMSLIIFKTNTMHKAYSYRESDFWNWINATLRYIKNKNNFKTKVLKTLLWEENQPGFIPFTSSVEALFVLVIIS